MGMKEAIWAPSSRKTILRSYSSTREALWKKLWLLIFKITTKEMKETNKSS